MKKILLYYSLSGLFLLGGLTGCQDDTVEEKPVVPAKTGDEISFGSSLDNGESGSRTSYDDTPYQDGDKEYYRVSWEDGDQIAIYCPQASQGTLVDYRITPLEGQEWHSSAVDKVDEDKAGLQWGTEEEHHFYGFYPASRVTGTENGKIRAFVPTTQNVESWNIVNENGGKTYYGQANTDYAYMWAYGCYNKSEMGERDVPLTFHPWMTVLEITIPGPTSGTMKVSNINIRAIEGSQTVLSGHFYCDMTPVEQDPTAEPNYEPANEAEGDRVYNTISISGYREDVDEFVELGPNDKMVVRAFLLPIDENIPSARNLQISVATVNGGAALTRTLGWSNHGEGSIVPHAVNKVILPNLTVSGKSNYWMSNLDPDIYLSEVSMPGSKFSYLTSENGANPVYQGATISQQFIDGVRAFIVQTDVEAVYNRSGWWPNYSYSYRDATFKITDGGDKTLANTISDIAAALAAADAELGEKNNECAVVMVTYNGASANYEDTPGGAYRYWMDAIENELAEWGRNPDNRIYTDPIDANTTLGDVAGHIIFKVNYNVDNSGNDMSDYSTRNGTCPALFTAWDGLIKTADMRWGTATATGYQRQTLKWMYHEATHVGSSGEAGITNTAEIKLNNVKTIFENSVNAYQSNDAHDTWFMNDCGGVFSGTVTTGIDEYDKTTYDGGNTSVIALTQWMNAEVRQILQTREENASTGLVFFNFADKQEGSGRQYGTDELIQTIIDNNFKFNLRKRGGTSSNAMSVQSASSYASGGNVWE